MVMAQNQGPADDECTPKQQDLPLVKNYFSDLLYLLLATRGRHFSNDM
jgi:hypothetical protein